MLPDKQLIKFVEKAEDTYDIGESVYNPAKDIIYLKHVKDGDSVEVLFDKDDVVVCVKKITSKSSETSTKKEEKTTTKVDGEVKEWTIKAITTKKDVVKFEEGETSWYIIPKDVRDAFADIKAKDVVRVVIGTATEKGKEKPAVISVEKTESQSTEKSSASSATSESYSDKLSYESQRGSDTNNSIERQVALKEAGATLRAIIEAQREEVNTVDKSIIALKKLTKAGLDAMYQ